MPTHPSSAGASSSRAPAHQHNREGPCHFSLMSLSAGRRLALCVVPLLVLWALVAWATGWL
ncbi:hypothetical protein [Vreelandella jeotgali]|uniref:hypothetical protein n=1 Tax=Vreelandella jeotgali TaxID=553386 RepID=UPI000A055739|nr:hypothetical protein [Halomonas jeotgali]